MNRTVDVPIGSLYWVDVVMDACIALIRPKGLDRAGFCEPVAICFYNSIDEVAKANLAARQATVALWPAIITTITGIHPDPNDLVYDNLLWAMMFAATSGGMAGFAYEKPNKYFYVTDREKGRELCVNGFVGTNAEGKCRTLTRRKGVRFLAVMYGCLFLCLLAYIAFLATFMLTLKRTILTWRCSPYWFGSLWYWLGSLPALLQAGYRIFGHNNVTLFEERERGVKGQGGYFELVSGEENFRAGALNRSTFVPYSSTDAFSIWMRILSHQFANTPYRLLVIDDGDRFSKGLFDLIVGGLRLGLFLFGSVTQGSLIVMPTPTDSILLGVIALATFLPRAFWSRNWRRSGDGADRVVFVCDGISS
jgi:hypothetical protein